jgi:hypothetical protein
VISNKQAFDRLTLTGGSVDPLLRKALLHLEERLSAIEKQLADSTKTPEQQPSAAPMDAEVHKAYKDLSFAELRAECRAQGLPAGGTRDELIGRLESA